MAAFSGALRLLGNLELKFPTVADEDFLLQLFVDARPWLSWAEGQRDFLRHLYEQQYQSMRVGQESVYPEHLDFVVERLGQRVGRVVIDLGYADWRIAELQVHPLARGKSIGSNLMRSLQQAASGVMMPITLSAPMFGSDAVGFYKRLGFQVTGTTPPALEMAWYPPGHQTQPNIMTR